MRTLEAEDVVVMAKCNLHRPLVRLWREPRGRSAAVVSQFLPLSPCGTGITGGRCSLLRPTPRPMAASPVAARPSPDELVSAVTPSVRSFPCEAAVNRPAPSASAGASSHRLSAATHFPAMPVRCVASGPPPPSAVLMDGYQPEPRVCVQRRRPARLPWSAHSRRGGCHPPC